jgi:hypothetical protein
MGGLLYQDFVSVGGKRLVRFTIVLTVVYMVLRIAFPGTAEYPDLMAVSDSGERVNLVDAFFLTAFGFFLLAALYLLNSFVTKIVDGDDRNQIKVYLYALPLGKNTYLASKYIFIGIAAYILLSMVFIWDITAMAFCGEGEFLGIMEMLQSVLVPFICLVLLVAAVELPMFLLLGTERAKMVKIVTWMVIAFLVIGFLLFGDLRWFSENFNIANLVKWCQTHTMEVMLTATAFPVFTLVCYYLSYRFTCHFFKGAGYE